MWPRLKYIYNAISEYLVASRAEIVDFRDDLGNMAVINFRINNQICRIYMDQDQDHLILGDLSKNKRLSDEVISDFEGVLDADGFGPTGRENGLCRIRISIDDQRDIFYEKNDVAAKNALQDRLKKFDSVLASHAIEFLKSLRE